MRPNSRRKSGDDALAIVLDLSRHARKVDAAEPGS
jgi:hypothetical protein